MSRGSENVKRWRKRTKDKLVAALGGKCRVCGYMKSTQALSLHHVDPTVKEFGFGAIRATPVSWERIAVEAKKCLLLCSNCHAEVHDGSLDISELELIFIECIPSDRAR